MRNPKIIRFEPHGAGDSGLAEWDAIDAGKKAGEEIGDCYAPGIIAMAVYAGHQYAR